VCAVNGLESWIKAHHVRKTTGQSESLRRGSDILPKILLFGPGMALLTECVSIR
jgi:hypothetical protein